MPMDDVARALGITPSAYAAHEAGLALTPAALARIAELFGVPVLTFFQDVAIESEGDRVAAARPGGVYRVATIEERLQWLSGAFRRLDLDGQRQLLALAGSLARGAQKAARRRPARRTPCPTAPR